MPHLAGLELPKIRRVTIEQPKEDPLDDLEGRVREALKGCKKLQSLSSGNRVAIAVGSRGIAEVAPPLGKTARFNPQRSRSGIVASVNIILSVVVYASRNPS